MLTLRLPASDCKSSELPQKNAALGRRFKLIIPADFPAVFTYCWTKPIFNICAFFAAANTLAITLYCASGFASICSRG